VWGATPPQISEGQQKGSPHIWGTPDEKQPNITRMGAATMGTQMRQEHRPAKQKQSGDDYIMREPPKWARQFTAPQG